MAGPPPTTETVFVMVRAAATTVTVCASWQSRTPGVPLVSVHVKLWRLGLLLGPLYHCVAPATFVSETPTWLLASSCVWYTTMRRCEGPMTAAALRRFRVSVQVGFPT